MEIKKMDIDNYDIEFINQSVSTRNGFKHESVCFINGVKVGKNVVHYLNRTWESYRFQTVMSGLIYKLIEDKTEYLKEEFKKKHGYKKLTPKRKEEFQKFVNDDSGIIFYNKIREALK